VPTGVGVQIPPSAPTLFFNKIYIKNSSKHLKYEILSTITFYIYCQIEKCKFSDELSKCKSFVKVIAQIITQFFEQVYDLRKQISVWHFGSLAIKELVFLKSIFLKNSLARASHPVTFSALRLLRRGINKYTSL
jgi:hypothetical protein